MAEERDVPTLGDLLSEIDATVTRLDQASTSPVTAAMVMDEIRNTILPLMKDIVASTGFGFEDIQDIIDPVKIAQGDAEEISALLKAFAASRPTDAALQERIAQATEVLEQDDEDEEEGTETETN